MSISNTKGKNQVIAANPNYFVDQRRKAGLSFDKNLVKADIPADIIKKVSPSLASEYHICPIKEENGILFIGTNSERPLKEKAELQDKLNTRIDILSVHESNLRQALLHYYDIDLLSKHVNDNVQLSDSRLGRLIDNMLMYAAQEGVSDIHMLPTPDGMDIKFRLRSGHLRSVSGKYNIPVSDIVSAVNIVKNHDTSGQANVSNNTMPNSGSWTFMNGTTTIYVRLSTVPIATTDESLHWQKVNMRLLPQTKKRSSLESLGYTKKEITDIRKAILQNATGLFLICGETGSGKTTSLYAMIDDLLRTGEDQIVYTIENPVEIHDQRFTQVQPREASDENISLTAPKILETALRQDPDIILYGEIRSKEDADVAIMAAMTGHKVFSTVHAKSCVSAISRLLDLGVSRSSLLSELNIIISQKLVAQLCPTCSKPHQLTDFERIALTEKEAAYIEGGDLREPSVNGGCRVCKGGYSSRTVVPEYILFDRELRDAFLNANISFSEIENIFRSRGFVTMWEKALDMVHDGRTDIMEALTVVGKEE